MIEIPQAHLILGKENDVPGMAVPDADKTREILDSLMLIFSVADLKADDLKKAADMRFKDYEDAIQSACATRIKANYIVTRNMKDFSEGKVTAIKPAELLDRI